MVSFQPVLLLVLTACVCEGVQVTVREPKRTAMLFQSVILQCQYHTPSSQAAVVQWHYKSYCRDRTRDSFTFSESLGVHGSDLGATAHVECSDSSRTVRVVASGQGASMTLAEHYKDRDIAIINKADLRIGKLQWGDSGVYFCIVIIADDVEGKNEAQVELLVLGKRGALDDLLPEFDVEIMPEWVFVGSVVLGSILFLLLMGICWCQCCPHSCCCYLRCCCCPETCCCPRHLYEAGKMAKNGLPPQMPMYPISYIPGVPMVPFAPSSHMEPKISLPSVDNNLHGVHSGYRLLANEGQDSMRVVYYVEKELAQLPSAKMATLQSSSLSELSSLHDGGDDFRQNYRTVQLKALPPIPDLGDQSVIRAAPRGRRHRRDKGNLSDDELDRRWNPRSEHLQRKTLSSRGRTGSLDELEEFARSYGPRGRRGDGRDQDGDNHGYSDDDGSPPPRRGCYDRDDGWRRRSPSPSLQKRRDTWDSDRPAAPRRHHDQGGGRGYDDAFLSGVLESKVRGGRGGGGDRGGRADEDSDTPSKGSSRGKASDCYYSRSPSNRPEEEDPLPPYSEVERHRDAERYRAVEPQNTERYRTVEPQNTDRYRAVEPQNTERYRTVEPQNTERYRTVEPQNTDRYRAVEPQNTERYRTTDPAMRPFSYTRPPQGPSHAFQEGRDERDRNRNLSNALSRGSLIV